MSDDLEELARLRQWKAEALQMFDGLQELGRALGVPLGTLVTGPVAIETAKRLRAERDAVVDSALDEVDFEIHMFDDVMSSRAVTRASVAARLKAMRHRIVAAVA